ncbi:MAG: hypothetical protein JXA10_16210 [Anaerolineae bacterium]|nr:hypothetical protein [Anaerolineae bacterium]
MSTYHIDYHWDADYPIPVLHVIVTGELPNPLYSLPALINRAHAYVDQCDAYDAVYLAYDMTGTSGKLPLEALLRRGKPSPKVKRAAIIGANSRSDEMAVLIMASARHIPYEFSFFRSLMDAAEFLTGVDVAQVTHS